LAYRNEKREVVTSAMIRAARALLGLDQSHVALLAGVARKTVALVEKAAPGKIDARRRIVLEAIRTSLENEFGVVFIFPSDTTGEGVRLRTMSKLIGERRD
jgi:DNA-binding XRE family transcriptional regulator